MPRTHWKCIGICLQPQNLPCPYLIRIDACKEQSIYTFFLEIQLKRCPWAPYTTYTIVCNSAKFLDGITICHTTHRFLWIQTSVLAALPFSHSSCNGPYKSELRAPRVRACPHPDPRSEPKPPSPFLVNERINTGGNVVSSVWVKPQFLVRVVLKRKGRININLIVEQMWRLTTRWYEHLPCGEEVQCSGGGQRKLDQGGGRGAPDEERS